MTHRRQKNSDAKKKAHLCLHAATALNRSGPIKPGGERAGLSAQLRPAAQSNGAVAGRRESDEFERVVGGWYIRRSRRRSAGEVGLNFSPHPRRPCPRTARTVNGPAHARRRAQSLGRRAQSRLLFCLKKIVLSFLVIYAWLIVYRNSIINKNPYVI